MSYVTEMLGNLGLAFVALATPSALLYVVVGTLAGICIGVLPGLTATMGLALCATLTWQMDRDAALIVLISLYVGAIYGGSRSAILLNIPGTPASAATVIDGFPLARSNRAGEALGVATTASFLGTAVGILFLVTVAPVLAEYALYFQSHEFFLLALFGILISGQLTAPDDPIKGWIAGFLGLAAAMVGQEQLYMTDRFTFGLTELQAGIGLIPAMVGAFGFSEVITAMATPKPEIIKASASLSDIIPNPHHVLKYKRTIVRSGILGTFVGVIPGVGEDVGAWVSYAAARRASKERNRFGKGSVEGLMAAETGNSAAPPGALIPVLTFGIPGSAPTAVLLAAMVLHGVRPGPMVMIESPTLVYELSFMMLFAAAAVFAFGLLLTPLFLRVLTIPRERLMPAIFVLCVVGSYALEQRLFDVWVMVAFGVVGYFLRRLDYPMAPLILGIILGDIFDKNFRRSLVISEGDILFYLQRPICALLILLCVATLVLGFPRMRELLAVPLRWIAPKPKAT